MVRVTHLPRSHFIGPFRTYFLRKVVKRPGGVGVCQHSRHILTTRRSREPRPPARHPPQGNHVLRRHVDRQCASILQFEIDQRLTCRACCTSAVYAPAGKPSKISLVRPLHSREPQCCREQHYNGESHHPAVSCALSLATRPGPPPSRTDSPRLPRWPWVEIDAVSSVHPTTSSLSHTPTLSTSFTTSPVPSVSPEQIRTPVGQNATGVDGGAFVKVARRWIGAPCAVSYSQDPSSWSHPLENCTPPDQWCPNRTIPRAVIVVASMS